MANLILSVTDNYNYYQLIRFFKTLKATGYTGHMCLFVGPNTGKNTVAKLKTFGIEIIRFREEFPFIKDPHPENVSELPKPIHVYNYRFYLYYDYLLKHGYNFSQVMLSDIRDVVFQKDPFQFEQANAIMVAMENAGVRLGECQYNTKWMLAGYDETMLKKVSKEVISCSGTTYAPTNLMMEYLQKMLRSIQQIKDAYHCGDQAVHNVLLHTGQLQPVFKMDNDTGPVLTLGSENNYSINDDQWVLNNSGRLVNIVHQYDRHKELNTLFDRKVYPTPFHRWLTKRFYRMFP